MLLLAPLFGIDVSLSLWLLPIGALTALSLSGLAIAIGTRAPSEDAGRLLASGLGILIAMFSPVYYELARLPEALQWLARLSPYTHAAVLLNGLLDGRGLDQQSAVWLVAVAALLVVVGVGGMRWREA
jgi:ABC-type multidrug transport system permease subunit